MATRNRLLALAVALTLAASPAGAVEVLTGTLKTAAERGRS